MSGTSKDGGNTRFATLFFLACFLILGYLLVVILEPFLSQLLWACVLTVVFHPLFRKILKLSRGRRAAASLITCLLILLLFVLPVSWLVVAITQQSIGLYQEIQANMEGEAAARLQEFQRRPWVQWALAQSSKRLGTRGLNLRQAVEQFLTIVSRFLVGQTPSFLK